MDYQVTLFCATGKYKPVSCIVKQTNAVDLNNAEAKKQILNKGMQKICNERRWSAKDLITYGFKTGKVRVYDKEKLDKEAEERYNKIKEEKYASGEWKRPKKQMA